MLVYSINDPHALQYALIYLALAFTPFVFGFIFAGINEIRNRFRRR